MIKKIYLFLISVLFLVACQSDRIKRAELANIQVSLKNGASQKIVIEKITPTEIITIDSVITDQNGKALIRIVPENEEMILLQFPDQSFIPLIVAKNSTTLVTADCNTINTTFDVSEGIESERITKYFRRLFLDKSSSDSLAKVLDSATITSDFANIRENVIATYNDIYFNHKAFADSIIQANPAALSNLFILNQSIGQQRLFEMTRDSSLYFLVDDSLTQHFAANAHVLRNHELIGEFKAALAVRKMAQQRLSSGNKAPNFMLTDVDGHQFTLESLSGKTVLIAFWASWDGRFHADLEMLKTLYQDYKNIDFEIVAVSMDEKDKLWKNAVEHQHVSWINVSDLKGVHSPLVRMYNLNDELPEYYLIDKEGIIKAQHPTMMEIDDILYQQKFK